MDDEPRIFSSSLEDVLASKGDDKQDIMKFMREPSIELSLSELDVLPKLHEHLRPETLIYVPNTPSSNIDDIVAAAGRIQEAGFRACPHIAARRITSKTSLYRAMDSLYTLGCRHVLVIAGDTEDVSGPYRNSIEVLASGAIEGAGIKHLGIAGYPQGHPRISIQQLMDSLLTKLSMTERTGTRVHLVTQFCFDSGAVIAWIRDLQRKGIYAPVHVGLAGPTPINKLIRYAVACGAIDSLGLFARNPALIARLRKAVRSTNQILAELLRQSTPEDHRTMSRPHIYAFGGGLDTARWMRTVYDGQFELTARGITLQT